MKALPMLLCSFALGCPNASVTPQAQTLSAIGEAVRAIRQFEAVRGTPPADWNELCRFQSSCPDSWRDGWGSPLVLVREGEHFRVLSRGRDRVPSSEDDVIYSSGEEEPLLARRQGCYEASLTPRFVAELRTDAVRPSAYRVSTDPAGGDGVWLPIGEYTLVELANGSHLAYVIIDHTAGAEGSATIEMPGSRPQRVAFVRRDCT